MLNPLLYLPYLLLINPKIGLTPSLTTQHCIAIQCSPTERPCNRVYNTALPIDEEIEQIKKFYGDIPFTWPVEQHNIALQQILRHHKLTYKYSFPAMSKELSDLKEASYTRDSIIKIVDRNDLQALHEWITVFAASFHAEYDAFKQVLHFFMQRTDSDTMRLYIGYYQDIPATVCMTLRHDRDIATLHWIGTLPAYRNKGLGFTITHTALRNLKAAGCTHALLLASELGKPLYERMGFSEYALYHMYGNYH